MPIGARLKQIRKAWRLSQKGMAKKLGIAISTYQYYERGERDVPAQYLQKLTSHAVNPKWLLTGMGNMKITNGFLGNSEIPPDKTQEIDIFDWEKTPPPIMLNDMEETITLSRELVLKLPRLPAALKAASELAKMPGMDKQIYEVLDIAVKKSKLEV